MTKASRVRCTNSRVQRFPTLKSIVLKIRYVCRRTLMRLPHTEGRVRDPWGGPRNSVSNSTTESSTLLNTGPSLRQINLSRYCIHVFSVVWMISAVIKWKNIGFFRLVRNGPTYLENIFRVLFLWLWWTFDFLERLNNDIHKRFLTKIDEFKE